MTDTEVVIEERSPALQPTPNLPAVNPTPSQLMEIAVRENRTEMFANLMVLEKEWRAMRREEEREQARKAFDRAMAGAKAEIPIIFKNRKVDFTSAKGRTNYRYEDLGEVLKTVDPILAKHGLNARFDTKNDNQSVTATCIITHEHGHFITVTLTAPVDVSGNKNSVQAIMSTATYLHRYTIKSALGLAASEDDDARRVDNTLIDEEQLKELSALIADTKTKTSDFCSHFDIESLPDMPASEFAHARSLLIQKKEKIAKDAPGEKTTDKTKGGEA